MEHLCPRVGKSSQQTGCCCHVWICHVDVTLTRNMWVVRVTWQRNLPCILLRLGSVCVKQFSRVFPKGNSGTSCPATNHQRDLLGKVYTAFVMKAMFMRLRWHVVTVLRVAWRITMFMTSWELRKWILERERESGKNCTYFMLPLVTVPWSIWFVPFNKGIFLNMCWRKPGNSSVMFVRNIVPPIPEIWPLWNHNHRSLPPCRPMLDTGIIPRVRKNGSFWFLLMRVPSLEWHAW